MDVERETSQLLTILRSFFVSEFNSNYKKKFLEVIERRTSDSFGENI